jgi:hypothetical protein
LPTTATVVAPSPATAPQSPSRVHRTSPVRRSCASTTPRIVTTTESPATAALDGWPPTRLVQVVGGVDNELGELTQVHNSFRRRVVTGSQPVVMNTAVVSAAIPMIPSAASNRPNALPPATPAR